MFIKIKEEEIIEIGEILRVKKDIITKYEETEEYKEYIKKSNMFCFFVGQEYTDKVISEEYKLIINTKTFDELIFEFDDIDQLEKEFKYIWNSVPILGDDNE